MTLAATHHGGRRTWRVGRWALAAVAGLGPALEAENDRWFLWGTVLFGTGIWIYFALPVEPTPLVVLAVCAVALTGNAVWRQGTGAVVVAGGLLALALGLTAAKLRTATAGGPILPRPMLSAEVTGYVELVEPRPGRGQRLSIRVLDIQGLKPDERPRRVRVRIPGTAVLVAGDAVRLKATLAAPALPALPGDYDFGRAAWFQGIGAVGYALKAPERVADAPPPPPDLAFWARVEAVRQAIGQRIKDALPGETGALATALVTGERGGISDATNEAYRAAGLYHMLSISGLHMVIVAGSAFWVVRLVLALVPWIALRLPIRKVAAVVAALAALGYLLISGGAPATARSWLTVTIGFLAVLADRPAIALRTVAISALVILALAPETLLDVGFQMSYAAVIALVAAYEELRHRFPAPDGEPRGLALRLALSLGAILLSTLVAGLATAPFSAYHFHQSQQYGLITNFIAIPIANLVVMPAALAAMLAMPLGLEHLPLALMGWGLDLVTAIAYRVAALPGALLPLPAMPDIAFALMVIGGLWLCLWRRRWRILGLAVAAIGLALTPFAPRPDLLVGHDGELVAVRGSDGQLAAPSVKGAAFAFKRWREHDGAPVQRAVADTGRVFRCDAVGCVARVRGFTVAVPRHPAALAEDCRQADVVVIAWPRPRFCRPRHLVVDAPAVRESGTHVVSLRGDRLSVTTVAEGRGKRPWVGRGGPQPDPPAAGGASRLGLFPPEPGFGHASGRAEVEDEETAWRADEDAERFGR